MDAVNTDQPGKIVGHINHIRVVRDSDQRPVWLISLDLDGKRNETVTLTDDDVARRLGMDARNPTWRPNSSIPLVFDVRRVQDGFIAVDVQKLEMPAAPPPPTPDATNPDLLLALVRNEARAALSASMAICRQSRLVPKFEKKLAWQDYEAWNTARGAHNPERERLALLRALRVAREAAEAGVKFATDPSSQEAVALTRARDLCDRALQFMRAAKFEAQDGIFDISKSSAVGKLLDQFPQAAQQSAAMVAWAAYFTIRNHDQDGAHVGSLSAIRTSLARAYRAESNAHAEIGAALDSAWRALVLVQHGLRRGSNRHRIVNTAVSNIESAMKWANVQPPKDGLSKTLPDLASSLERFAMLRNVLDFQRRRKKHAVRVEPDGKGGIRGEFLGGETLHVSKNGVIRVLDQDGKLAILASQDTGVQHFEKGSSVDEDEISIAVGVAEPAYRM